MNHLLYIHEIFTYFIFLCRWGEKDYQTSDRKIAHQKQIMQIP